jgi:hypothetical protein
MACARKSGGMAAALKSGTARAAVIIDCMEQVSA